APVANYAQNLTPVLEMTPTADLLTVEGAVSGTVDVLRVTCENDPGSIVSAEGIFAEERFYLTAWNFGDDDRGVTTVTHDYLFGTDRSLDGVEFNSAGVRFDNVLVGDTFSESTATVNGLLEC